MDKMTKYIDKELSKIGYSHKMRLKALTAMELRTSGYFGFRKLGGLVSVSRESISTYLKDIRKILNNSNNPQMRLYARFIENPIRERTEALITNEALKGTSINKLRKRGVAPKTARRGIETAINSMQPHLAEKIRKGREANLRQTRPDAELHRQIISLRKQNLTEARIAKQLNISPVTVSKHLKSEMKTGEKATKMALRRVKKNTFKLRGFGRNNRLSIAPARRIP